MISQRIMETVSETDEITGIGKLLGPDVLWELRERRTSDTSAGEVGEVKKEFGLRLWSHLEKWWRVRRIFDRRFPATVELKLLKALEIIEGSEVIELISFKEMIKSD